MSVEENNNQIPPEEADRLLEKMLKVAREAGRKIIHFPGKGQEKPAETIVKRLEGKD